ncbi:MAG: hypothetical protein WKG32_13000 [Gemmatimonadaceae bacterium]
MSGTTRMSDGFEFRDGNRTFTCSAEPVRGAGSDIWWWFRVSTDDRHRYAPFHADPTDTREGVQSRVVAYYDDLLARRAMPATHNHWGRRPGAPAASPAPATPPAPESGASAI